MEDYFNEPIALSEKEEKILKLLATGRKSTEMAEELHLSLSAIKWYRQRLKAKFNAATTGELVRLAIEKGLI